MLLNSSSRSLSSKGSEPEAFSPFVKKADELEVGAWGLKLASLQEGAGGVGAAAGAEVPVTPVPFWAQR